MSAWQQCALPPWLLALVRGAKLGEAVAQEANDGLASAEGPAPASLRRSIIASRGGSPPPRGTGFRGAR
jgi:hypothetical protein